MTGPLHDDELLIDLNLVRALVDRALPEYASLPLSRLGASGSSNALFRLGDGLLIRLPRQPGGSASIEKEARWLPLIGPLLPVSVPEVVAVGEPGLGYPERWSVVRWLDGDVPAVAESASHVGPMRLGLARDLAAVVTALHDIDVPQSAVADPQLRWYRGAPLESMDVTTRRYIAECRGISGLDLDLEAALQVWEEAIALPEPVSWSEPRWYHGDLVAENLLVRGGRLAAVLDFGALAVGDPTVDLIVAWDVLDPASRDVFRRAVGVDETTWLRGRAWALSLALGTFPYYWSTMTVRCASRLAVVRSVLADAVSTPGA
ncbi:aminoglycoside phosphotransferase family protein [Cellulomonas sp. KRMCY2]|uniref:aminoglycoside phosphotransferase family protein n=1 Tax=Cellulomonas sp. KRMCY2 TaxID=1304865 RepID=UPI00045EAB84|nr:aminoglycoside phosphotransferase family protein [Cellulomonas sp. KRMCY2]